jgi:hypothetical protein
MRSRPCFVPRTAFACGAEFADLFSAFPFLSVPAITACIALGDGKSGAGAVVRFCHNMRNGELTASFQRRTRQNDWFESDPIVR